MTGERQARPIALLRPTLPHAAFQVHGLPERADEQHAGTWTVTRTHPCQVRQPVSQVHQPESESAPESPGPEEGKGGPVSRDTEPEIHEGSETDLKMARGRHTETHTHTHTQGGIDRERETEPLTEGKWETDTGERMASDPRQTRWYRM